jgi:CubicO group peptidase (beta-lactamase class C family)
VLGYIAQEALVYERGSRSLYSDLGFMLLGWAVERLAGESLDQFCNNQIYRPLEAQPLAYVPRESQAMPAASLESHAIAPTEDDPWRGRMLCGEVHDENAFALGGVAGHAGLFGTARAVLAVAKAWMDGRRGKTGLLQPDLVTLFTTRQQGIPNAGWALGWDTPSAPSSSGTRFTPESFGHLGYTGTSLWIDPVKELEVVLLSNRVHPTRKNERIKTFRPLIHDLICREFLGRLGWQVRIVGPGFFFGQVAVALEVQASAQSGKPDSHQLLDDGLDGSTRGGVSGAFDSIGLIGDFPRIARRHTTDEHRSIKISVARVDPLDLMPFD